MGAKGLIRDKKPKNIQNFLLWQISSPLCASSRLKHTFKTPIRPLAKSLEAG